MTRATKFVAAMSILAVAARLTGIDQAFIDCWSWRQSDVAAIARNFLENGFRFAWPQIDWAGDQPGYVGTEFPVLPFTAAICYKVFGIHEWIGRSQSVIFFALSLPFFFLLVRQIFDEVAAFWALFFYSFPPLNWMASRCFMPDVPSLSLSIVGLYFFLRWTESRRSTFFFASAVVLSLSILIKVTSLIVFAPLAYLAVAAVCDRHGLDEPEQRSCGRFPQIALGAHRAPLQLTAFVAITILPAAVWYWHAYQVSQRFYPYHLFGAGGIQIENLNWYAKIARLTLVWSLTPVLSLLAIIGLFAATSGKFGRLFHWWIGATIIFIVIAGYGNRHPWYQLPLVPITSALAGTACTLISNKIARPRAKVLLSSLVVAGFGVFSFIHAHELFQPEAAQYENAGLALKRITPPGALIITADNGDPTILYYAQRKGWHFPEKNGIWWGNPQDSEQLIANLGQLQTRRAAYFVITRNNFWWFEQYAQFSQDLAGRTALIETAPEFKIYKFANR